MPRGAFAVAQDTGIYPPSQVGGDADWDEVVLGANHGCARKVDGAVWCWGANEHGQVGTTDAGIVTSPVLVTGTWQGIAAGASTTCAFTAAGALACWGSNADGQLGDGTTDDASAPVANPTLAGVTQVVIGERHACAIAGDMLWCWGRNTDGEIGDQTKTPSFVPLQVPGAWKRVSAGFFKTTAIAADGTLWEWGHGVGTTRTQVGTRADWVEASTPYVGRCAIDTAGGLWCGGANKDGELGLGGTEVSQEPLIQIEPGRMFSTIVHTTNWGSTKEYVGCANRDDALVCAGTGWRGQLGDGDIARWSRAPRRVSTGHWEEVRTLEHTTCGRAADGVVACWGRDPTEARGSTSTPTPMSTESFVGFAVDDLSCARHATDGVWAWGWIPTSNTDGTWGQPARVVATAASSLACADGRGAYVDGDGVLWAWGRNDAGQLGDGTTTFRPAPVEIATGMASVDLGHTHACAIGADRTLSCWGTNASGELGDGTFDARMTPTQVSTDAWTMVAASAAYGGHTCGIKVDASLWCWGSNTNGQLGDGVPSSARATPERVGVEAWAYVDTAQGATCGVREDRSLWCWGSDRGGRVTGTYGPAGADGPSLVTPTQFGADADWDAVALSISHACARKTSGEVWCWGTNDEGQLGTVARVDVRARRAARAVALGLSCPRPMAEVDLPQRARVVVVGGGIIGCSVAYHLAHMGWKDVVLLERDKLTSGTTWHAAGLMVTFGSTSETSTEFRKYSADLYERLEAETGQSTGFKRTGFIEVAGDRDRLEEYRRVSAFNRHMGIDVQEISPGQVKELFPLANVDDLLAGFYVARDGRADPVGVTMALAKGARQAGARLIEDVPVLGVTTKRGAVTGVTTAYGAIECEYVVNCAGMWARQLGAQNGVSIPLQAAEHYYLVTERIPEVSRDWPVLEDPSSYTYIREEVGGLMIGLFEPVCAPWNVRGIPDDFSFGEIQPDWERMGPYVEKAMARVPISMTAGVKKFFCGPESFTPDLAPLLGEAPEVKNYFVAAGLNSIGILTGGGVGRMMAHWIINGRPDVDVTGMHIDRLHAYQTTPDYRRTRTVESLGMVYKTHYPTHTMETARGAKKSPFYDRLAARGAYFRDVCGWEGADWFKPAEPRIEQHSWGRQHWFPTWEAEHRACRDGVIVMDMSFMSKFLVEGRDAGKLLDYLSANSVDGAAGQITYTQWLDEAGKLQADLTVTKLDDERYWVVASDTVHRHVETWMRRHTSDGAHVHIADMTGAYAQLNIQGPRSRALMQAVTSADMSNEAFPFRGARWIDIGFARALCIRITYLGELGYELYIPVEQALHVYDRLVETGEPMGLVHAGLKTLASCRMEKGYRDYGHDIDNTDTVLEVGLGFAVDLAKPDFLGKAAVVAQKAAGPLKQRLLQILIKDPQPLLFHAEIVKRDGVAVGYVRAASYGHTLGGAVGLAMIKAPEGGAIDQKWIDAGTWQVEIAGTDYPAVASLKPLFDPANKKIKG